MLSVLSGYFTGYIARYISSIFFLTTSLNIQVMVKEDEEISEYFQKKVEMSK